MTSPFPGMDPYIEECGLWEDFHKHLIEKIAEHLAAASSDRYFVRAGERAYIVIVRPAGKAEQPIQPDVSVTSTRGRKKSPKRGGVALAEPAGQAAPFTLRAFLEEEHRERFVEIYLNEPERRLVTRIEVLSPSNKRKDSAGWEQYQRERQSILLDYVNLVEIDLLRGGTRMPMLDPWPCSPYVLMVARARDPLNCEVWPAHFREPLPVIPVPLARPDSPILLELQPMIDAIFKVYRYGQAIDYSKPLTPPLSAEETEWMRQRHKANGKRLKK